MKVIYSDIKIESFNNHFTSCPLILLKLSKFPDHSKFEGFKSLRTSQQRNKFYRGEKERGGVGGWFGGSQPLKAFPALEGFL